jgi:hypothetical protein
VNLHKTIYDLLNGHNANVAITCNPQVVTLTPAQPISVPSGFGIDGTLNSVSILPKDVNNVVFHGTFLGFKREKVKTV